MRQRFGLSGIYNATYRPFSVEHAPLGFLKRARGGLGPDVGCLRVANGEKPKEGNAGHFHRGKLANVSDLGPHMSADKIAMGFTMPQFVSINIYVVYLHPWALSHARNIVGLNNGKRVFLSDSQRIPSPLGGLLSDFYRSFSRHGSALRIPGGGNGSAHGESAEDEADATKHDLPPRPMGTVIGSVSRFPLGAKIGLAVIAATLATLIWARGNWLFWGSRIGGRGLAGYGLGSLGIFALSAALFAWASPY
ncbi:MAG: hypothetical protein JNL35_01035 [Sphingopyxis sp.]|nr:hypothetical protein [Sphingopyxis sp.]